MHSRNKENASSSTKTASLVGISPPKNRTLLAHTRQCSPSTRTEWRWSGWAEASALRRWKWDEYRLAACRELPLSLECRKGEDPRLDYIQTDAIADFLRDDNQGSVAAVKLVVSFTEGICAPYRPLLDSAILTKISNLFSVQELQEHYPSHVISSFWRKGGPENTTQTFACSTGYAAVYPLTVVTSYNVETDEVRGYIISDLGGFDHFALSVLVLERSLECIMNDLEYLNNHTVVENVTLNREYADKIAEYRAWWAGWQNRLSIIQRTGDWLLCQLNDIHEWAPQQRVKQYSADTRKMQERLEQVVRCWYRHSGKQPKRITE
ncbi:hypothetical protein GQ44DRAFT_732774 [Phaeosphaeriaceae sp. PMI808]|nr:hypothetical protein GQ44DRAFT_732774 [Phaeosphaeriaceae sp. PMI808]